MGGRNISLLSELRRVERPRWL